MKTLCATALTLSLLAWFTPRRAEACSGYQTCNAPRLDYSSGVPANATLVVLGPDGGTWLLRDADGGVVPTSGEAFAGGPNYSRAPAGFYVTPTSPLIPGERYRLDWISCLLSGTQPGDGGTLPTDGGTAFREFTAGPDAPLPTSPLVISTAGSGWEMLLYTEAVYGRVTVSPAADLVPWLPLTRWTTVVNGIPQREFGFGEVFADGGTWPPPGYIDARQEQFERLDRFRNFCSQVGSASCGPYFGYSPGHYQVRVRAQVAGGPTLESNEVTVQVPACSPPADDGGTPLDGGANDGGTDSPDAGSVSPDAGVGAPDAGWVPTDGGASAADAGSTTDAGTSAADAGVPDAGGNDAGAGGEPPPGPPDLGGGGCSAVPGASLLALSALRLLVRRRVIR